MNITRNNVDQLLDAGKIECAMTSGSWWTIRRNGKTQKWKKDPNRIRIPFKMGLYGYGSIDENSFAADGVIHPDWFRLKEES